MATTTTKSVKITLAYEDATSRTYTFNGVTTAQASNVKYQVLDINDSLEAGTANSFAHTFISDNGSPCKMISKAQVISLEQEVIYSAN